MRFRPVLENAPMDLGQQELLAMYRAVWTGAWEGEPLPANGHRDGA
jgi:hypothetical protein